MSPQKAWLPSLSRQSTSEIFTTTDYGLTQLWASAFRLAGFGGIRYWARHLALFGPADLSKSLAGFEVVDTDHLPDCQDLLDQFERETGVTVLAFPPV